MVRISFCIPTYNRADLIRQTLDSILSQGDPNVEVVVADNASTDNTREVIEAYNNPHMTYFCWDKNQGPERNLFKAVQLATGDYCWLMGSDDCLEPEALAHVRRLLEENPGLSGISTNSWNYDRTFSQKQPSRPPFDLRSDRVFRNAEACVATLGAWLPYFSAQIVERDRWNDAARQVDISRVGLGTHTVTHLEVLGHLIQNHPYWLYCHRRCVGYRGGNDAYEKEFGPINRMKVNIIGFDTSVRNVFRSGRVPRQVMGRVLRHYVHYDILGAKLHRQPLSFYMQAFAVGWNYVRQNPCFWIYVVPIMCVPSICLRWARWIYRATLKRWRIRQLRRGACSRGMACTRRGEV